MRSAVFRPKPSYGTVRTIVWDGTASGACQVVEWAGGPVVYFPTRSVLIVRVGSSEARVQPGQMLLLSETGQVGTCCEECFAQFFEEVG